MYKQCELSKKTADGVMRQVAWIPEKFAIVGHYLEIKGDNGWHVDSATEPAMDESILTQKTKFPSLEKK